MSVFFSAASEFIVHDVGYQFKSSTMGYFLVAMARITLSYAVDLKYLSSVIFFLLPFGSAFNVTETGAAIKAYTVPSTRFVIWFVVEVLTSIQMLNLVPQ